jgi:hypothetical protein
VKSESWRSGLTQPANLSPSTSQLPRLQELRRPCAGSGKRWDYLTRLHRQSSQEELSRRGWRENGLSRRGWSGKKESSVRSRRRFPRQTGLSRHRFLRPKEGLRWCTFRQCAGSIAGSNLSTRSPSLRYPRCQNSLLGFANFSSRKEVCAPRLSFQRFWVRRRACESVRFLHEHRVCRTSGSASGKA